MLNLSIPNFSSLVDMNSDCIADIYLNVKDETGAILGLNLIAARIRQGDTESLKYCLVGTDNISQSEFTSPVFADFNNDAAIDKGFYKHTTNSIYLFYNERGANSASDSNL
mmetsp:Transcript_19232/g.22258  ORF Transcript_19232/g.22258 Transcript_19232/m.22258 type:complete len:111 (-) Transcript_19232:1014-1346(-)